MFIPADNVLRMIKNAQYSTSMNVILMLYCFYFIDFNPTNEHTIQADSFYICSISWQIV